MREREVKLGAGPAFHLPDLTGVVEGFAVADPETVRLVNAGGARVAEVVVDEGSVRDGRRVAARFREIEVELLGDGETGLIAPLVSRLRLAGAGAPAPTPKHIRALGPRAVEPPEVAPLPLAEGASARDVIRNALAEPVAS